MCFLNRIILARLLNTCNTAVNPKTILRLKKKPASGTKNTDEPKPPTVPMISHRRAMIAKSQDIEFYQLT